MKEELISLLISLNAKVEHYNKQAENSNKEHNENASCYFSGIAEGITKAIEEIEKMDIDK